MKKDRTIRRDNMPHRLIILISITLIGSLHLWSGPDDLLDIYFLFFTVFYLAVCAWSIRLAIIEKPIGFKIIAILNSLLALGVAILDGVFLAVVK